MIERKKEFSLNKSQIFYVSIKMKKRISLSRRITASELRAGHSECRIYTAEEIQEFRKNRMIELNRTKLLKVQETSAADSDYSSVSESAATDSDYSSVSKKSEK